MTLRLSPEEIGQRYDQIADYYEKTRTQTYGTQYIERFLSLLPAKGRYVRRQTILELGCGPGLPHTKQLVASGAKVYGLDISREMINKARKNVPGALFLRADVSRCEIERQFDAILAWDSLFHLPLDKQASTIRKITAWLAKDGVFLFTAGGGAGELRSTMHGVEFYYSSLSVEHYLQLLAENNCRVLFNELDDPSSHGHRVICCRKLK
ncbi:MAG: class I SAM-dependent methyltransferase [Firmicutes bacterium]|nr:class I SAM-dependent methyltransferase [Bacillota bacterium]